MAQLWRKSFVMRVEHRKIMTNFEVSIGSGGFPLAVRSSWPRGCLGYSSRFNSQKWVDFLYCMFFFVIINQNVVRCQIADKV